jgi:hypothetical protein
VQCIGQEGLILTQPARKCEKDLSEGFLASNGEPAAISFNRIHKMKELALTREKFMLPRLAQRNLGLGPSFALAAHSKVTLAGVQGETR